MRQSRFYKHWKTTVAGVLIVGVGLLRYKGYIDAATAEIATMLIGGTELVLAADSKNKHHD